MCLRLLSLCFSQTQRTCWNLKPWGPLQIQGGSFTWSFTVFCTVILFHLSVHRNWPSAAHIGEPSFTENLQWENWRARWNKSNVRSSSVEHILANSGEQACSFTEIWRTQFISERSRWKPITHEGISNAIAMGHLPARSCAYMYTAGYQVQDEMYTLP